MAFRDILEKYRLASFSEYDKGARFERLMRVYLKTDPEYANLFREVWLWEDFPARAELGGADTGVDLVALTEDGEYWAVQCKCYAPRTRIEKAHVDTFLSTSGRTFRVTPDGAETTFARRLWISTSDLWSGNAEDTLRGQKIPVTRIGLADLEKAPVDWIKLEAGVHGKAARLAVYTPMAHQREAIDAANEHFKNASRGRLIMACGTGKTFTALRIAEREAVTERLALVLVPSIALVGQLLREWMSHASRRINAVCVCSDPKVSQSRQKIDDSVGFATLDLAYPATTDAAKITTQCQNFKNTASPDSLTVIFSTYQSIKVVEEAQCAGLPEFDIIICDEAHRTTGVELSEQDRAAFVRCDEAHRTTGVKLFKQDRAVFTRVHEDKYVKGKKRMYMTATPRIYKTDDKAKAERGGALLCSMDDPVIYGEEIYHIGFGKAVEKNLLSDYKVVVFTVSENDVPPAFQEAVAATSGGSELPADTAAQIVGCVNALSKQLWGEEGKTLNNTDPGPMKRAVAFCQNIKTSKKISGLFDGEASRYIGTLPDDKRDTISPVASRHVDGTMNAPEREKLLNWLKFDDEDADKCKILSNVRCLSEGVDVPALDAILFLSARHSKIDVVQSVGRVMRRAPGKKYGYVIIPILVPSSVEPEQALNESKRYDIIWDVLNALRAHDDRFEAEVNKIELNQNKSETILIGRAPFSIDGDYDIEADEAVRQTELAFERFPELQNVIYARLVKKVGSRTYWEDWAKSVADIAARQIARITAIVATGHAKKEFNDYLAEMRESVDAGIDEYRAIEMLSQHSITAPVFDALFEGYAFAKNNAVSIAMDLILETLGQDEEAEKDKQELQKFYDSVRERAKGIDNAAGRQAVVIELYNTFFKTAFPKMAEMLGIVYTPVEVVDYIVRSADSALRAEFGLGLTDESVNILDPFTGTGTFITRLIQSGLIRESDLPRKYEREIFANEIVLLAYYIAAVNIENAYHHALGLDEYKPFEGIVLTDTFQAWEDRKKDVSDGVKMFDENTGRMARENKVPITVIFGNPPYSVGQRSANDNAKNKAYPRVDKRIADTYVVQSDAQNNNALYDSYIRAFRYATDRLCGGDDTSGGDGIICFVSNGGWLDGSSTAGFRKSIEQEFSKIYVFNLRGNARTSGVQRRKEGGNVFDSGSRAPVTVTLLVRCGGGGHGEVKRRFIIRTLAIISAVKRSSKSSPNNAHFLKRTRN